MEPKKPDAVQTYDGRGKLINHGEDFSQIVTYLTHIQATAGQPPKAEPPSPPATAENK